MTRLAFLIRASFVLVCIFSLHPAFSADDWCIERIPGVKPCKGQPGTCYRNPDGSKGGFVADTAKVERSVRGWWKGYLKPTLFVSAQVCDTAEVLDGSIVGAGARILGSAIVKNRAKIEAYTTVRDRVVDGEIKSEEVDSAKNSSGRLDIASLTDLAEEQSRVREIAERSGVSQRTQASISPSVRRSTAVQTEADTELRNVLQSLQERQPVHKFKRWIWNPESRKYERFQQWFQVNLKWIEQDPFFSSPARREVIGREATRRPLPLHAGEMFSRIFAEDRERFIKNHEELFPVSVDHFASLSEDLAQFKRQRRAGAFLRYQLYETFLLSGNRPGRAEFLDFEQIENPIFEGTVAVHRYLFGEKVPVFSSGQPNDSKDQPQEGEGESRATIDFKPFTVWRMIELLNQARERGVEPVLGAARRFVDAGEKVDFLTLSIICKKAAPNGLSHGTIQSLYDEFNKNVITFRKNHPELAGEVNAWMNYFENHLYFRLPKKEESVRNIRLKDQFWIELLEQYGYIIRIKDERFF